MFIIVELLVFIILFHYAILLALSRFSEAELRCSGTLVLFVLLGVVLPTRLFRLTIQNLFVLCGLVIGLFNFRYKYSILSASKTSFVVDVAMLFVLLFMLW